MKKIIIPVDFSKHSEYALETAAALAKQHNAELVVMHMLELSESILTSSSSDRNEETAFMLMVASKKFETFLDKSYLEGVSVTPLIKHHKVLKEVAEVANQIKADLIVIGSRGHSDHDGIFTGSNTEKVVRYSETPVLVVKSKLESVNFNTIVLATDFSEIMGKKFIDKTCWFFLNSVGVHPFFFLKILLKFERLLNPHS